MYVPETYSQFDSNLHISFSWEATDLLGREYWLLRKSFTYYIGHIGSDIWVKVPKGFLSDGASVPIIARILIPRMGRLSQAAFLHDWLCESYMVTMRNEEGEVVDLPIDRKFIDRIFYEALKVSQVPWWRRFLIETFVNLFRMIKRPTKPKPFPRKKELEVFLSELNNY